MTGTGRLVADLLSGAQRLLLATHPNPDGDGLGCLSTLALVLRAKGKHVHIYCPEGVPPRFGFLPELNTHLKVLPAQGVDVTVLVDCSDARVFGAEVSAHPYLGRIIALDHHKTVGDFPEIILRDPLAASAGVMVYRLLDELGWRLDGESALGLYCSLISDTGSFRYQNTNAEALRIAAELVQLGVEPWRVSTSLYETRPRSQLELLARVLRTLDVSGDGVVATLSVSEEMLRECNCRREDAEGFINFARGLDGVEVAVLLRLEGEGRTRVSMRSRGAVDVAAIAQVYGGGGHHNAAGFTADKEPAGVLAWLQRQVADSLRAAERLSPGGVEAQGQRSAS